MSKRAQSRLKKIQGDIETNSKEVNKIIADMRLQQKQAIQNLDFDTAETIENEINVLKEEAKNFGKDDIYNSFVDEAQQIVNGISYLIEEVRDDTMEKEKKIRVRVNEEFNELKAKHIKELIQMEKDYVAARFRETERNIPEREDLIRQSQNAAKNGDFESARKLHDQALLVAQLDLEQRLIKIDRDFDEIKKNAFKAQKDSIIYLSNILETDIKDSNQRSEIKIGDLLKNRDAQLIGHYNKFAKKLCSKESPAKNEIILNNLEKLLAETLFELDCPLPKGIGERAKTKARGTATKTQSRVRSTSSRVNK